jgi:hypothetical protein
MPNLEIQTQQRTATSTKIAVGFVVATAVMVVASFAAAVFATIGRPQSTAVTPSVTQPSVSAAAGVNLTESTVNGQTYTETVVSTD